MEKGCSKACYVTKIIIHILLGLLPVVFFFLAFTEAFGKQLCENNSTCYALIAFLGGIIVALKIKILDSKKILLFERRIVELVFFVLGIIVNVLFLITAYFLECNGKNEESLLILNATIWLDFIVFVRNIFVVIIIYIGELCNGWKQRKLAIEVPKKDLFIHWLKREDKSNYVKRALTDKSYKNVNPSLKTEETNFSLATFGDSIIKMCLTDILYKKSIIDISKERAKFESDEYLVKKVAKHYDLIKYIIKDPNDQKMPKDYEYVVKKGGNNPHKYIATAVEAMIGAIYLETSELEPIKKLVNTWRYLDLPDDGN